MNSGIQITDVFLKNGESMFLIKTSSNSVKTSSSGIAVSVSPAIGSGYNHLSENVNVAIGFP